MKNKIILFFGCLFSYGVGLTASTFSIAVPAELLTKQATLLLCMLDEQGNHCIGKCHLHNELSLRAIVESDLEIAHSPAVDVMQAVELASSMNSSDTAIVLHFEFDSSVQLLRILVVKSFLEDDPFTIVTVAIDGFDALSDITNEFDELSCLAAETVDVQSSQVVQPTGSIKASIEQYVLYTRIFFLLQLGRAKRALHAMTEWCGY